jgi:Fe-S cluster biogenesis protein NfuA
MKWLAYVHLLAAKSLHRSKIEDDLETEIRPHIQNRSGDLERSGLDRTANG